jgi:ubiquitin carboxyl-terminal hydrolase 34
MTAQDHHLAHSAAADDSPSTTTAPASPPRRDPVEDADPSFTRKRPRLDSGSNSIRALSADTEPLARTTASPREQQVEMTIRSHPPSSPVSAAVEQGHHADAMSDDTQNISPIHIPTTEDEPGSPEVVLIHDDDEPAPAPAFSVQMDATHHFQRFPWSAAGDYSQVVRELPKYFQGCKLFIMFLHCLR